MKQTINLVPGLDDPAARPLPPRLALGLLATVGVLGLAWGAVLEVRQGQARAVAQQLQQEVDWLADDLEDRGTLLVRRDASPESLAELARVEREAADKARVLEAIVGEQFGNTTGFSAHLDALARRLPAEVWLTRILITTGGEGLQFEGAASAPRQVPRLLDALADEAVFTGTTFQTLALQAGLNGQGPVRFTLATACLAGEAPSAGDCLAAPFGEGGP